MTNSTGTQIASFARAGIVQVRFYAGEGNDRFENKSDISSWATGDGGIDTLIGGVASSYFIGGAGNDFLIGNSGADQLYGNDGNDLLSGNGGNDRLEGGADDDALFGGDGDDALIGEDGNDHMYGDDGQDWMVGGAGNDRLEGGLGNDQLLGGIGDDTLVGAGGDDQLYGDDGKDWLAGGAGVDQLEGGIGDDTLVGGLGNDVLVGGDGVDGLFGEEGNDSLYGGIGNDRLDGGAGIDQLLGGQGDDVLSGGEEVDTIYGEEGNDWIAGGNGDDKLYGGIGNDRMFGGAGKDVLAGDAGDDNLYGEDGDDTLYGATGNDFLSGGAGIDRLEGEAGADMLLGGIGNDTLVGGDDNDQLFGDDGYDSLTGGNGNDRLDGGALDDTLLGGIGDDDLIGGEGNDELFGEDGVDWLAGGGGVDRIEGGNGDDTLVGGLGDDNLVGGDGNDLVYGEDGNDWLAGGVGNDQLFGGLGNDTLIGGIGNDTLAGGDNDDKLYGEDGDDWLSAGSGNDLLYGGLGDDVSYGGLGNDMLTGDAGADYLYGDDGDDTLYGSVGEDFLSGGAGVDRLEGEAGDDTLLGGFGNDTLIGGDGADEIHGDDGADYIVGGIDGDYLLGVAGDDYIVGNAGNDTIDGGDGNDQLFGEDGADTIFGGAGNDQIDGAAGDDTMLGGDADDSIYGYDGADVIIGDAGNDQLFSGNQNDIVVGGAGTDTIYAGAGNDVLIGGAGQDQLIGEEGQDLLLGGSTVYDGNVPLLRNLINAWGGAGTYDARLAQITDEAFSAHLMSEHTFYDDLVSDTLSGNSDQDWFIETGVMAVYRPSDVHFHEHEEEGMGGHHTEFIIDHLPALEGFALVDSIDKLVDRQTNETITSLLPHPESLTLQREHLSLFQLTRYDQVTHYAVNSGAWSSPTTWKNGIVPTTGSRVLIPSGVDVSIDGMIAARIQTIRVDGHLSFNTTRNTELKVDTIVVSSNGTFEMGTQANPIAAAVKARVLFTDNGPIDRTVDPFAIGRGLVSHGKVSIYGAGVTSYVALSVAPTAGTQSLLLKSIPTGWKVGDTVVIASTAIGSAQNETRIIQSLTGNIVALNQPLTYNHAVASVGLEVHVANVSRNAIFESESTTIDRRGHVMFMHNRDVDVAYAGFYKLGRTDKSTPIQDSVVQADWTLKAGTGSNPRARYAVHFHRTGTVQDGNPATVAGSVVVDSPGWGFVNHSSYVDMLNNVAFDVNGAAFATEVGDEIGGFYGNMAIGTTGVDGDLNVREQIQDFGFGGDGFWFQGGGVSVVGNISAGNDGNAFVYYTRGLNEGAGTVQFLAANLVNPSIANGAEKISVGQVPVRQFSDNVGYGSAIGLTVRYHLERATHGATSEFANSKFWNNGMGVDLPYTQNSTLRNIAVINGLATRPAVGVHGNLVTKNITYDNITIVNHTAGIELPRSGYVVVNRGTFLNNVEDLVLFNAAIEERYTVITGQVVQPKIMTVFDAYPIYNNTALAYLVKDVTLLNFGPFNNQRLYGYMQAANSIPFPVPRADLPAGYAGQTNAQLWAQFGKAVGGEVAPVQTFTVQGIIGLIGLPT